MADRSVDGRMYIVNAVSVLPVSRKAGQAALLHQSAKFHRMLRFLCLGW
jgi:hypothetical protein